MSAKIVTIAQQKGGAGKSTLAIQLAVAWSQMGYSVALVDIDPQGSVYTWDQVRYEVYGDDMPDSPSVRAITGWRTAAEVDRLKRDFDIVVVDSPPHAETESKIAIRSADLVLIPCQPSPIDLWATKPIIDLAVNEDTPTMTILNRVNSRANITGQIKSKAKQLDTVLAKTPLGNRVGYAESILNGQGVTEYAKSSDAAKEISSLSSEVLKMLGLGVASGASRAAAAA